MSNKLRPIHLIRLDVPQIVPVARPDKPDRVLPNGEVLHKSNTPPVERHTDAIPLSTSLWQLIAHEPVHEL